MKYKWGSPYEYAIFLKKFGNWWPFISMFHEWLPICPDTCGRRRPANHARQCCIAQEKSIIASDEVYNLIPMFPDPETGLEECVCPYGCSEQKYAT